MESLNGNENVTDRWAENQQRSHNLASYQRQPKPKKRARIAPSGMDLFTALRIAESVERNRATAQRAG